MNLNASDEVSCGGSPLVNSMLPSLSCGHSLSTTTLVVALTIISRTYSEQSGRRTSFQFRIKFMSLNSIKPAKPIWTLWVVRVLNHWLLTQLVVIAVLRTPFSCRLALFKSYVDEWNRGNWPKQRLSDVVEFSLRSDVSLRREKVKEKEKEERNFWETVFLVWDFSACELEPVSLSADAVLRKISWAAEWFN